MSRKSDKKPAKTGETRRRIDLSPPSPKKTEKSDTDRGGEWDEHRNEHLHMEAFELVWSKIYLTSKVYFAVLSLLSLIFILSVRENVKSLLVPKV